MIISLNDFTEQKESDLLTEATKCSELLVVLQYWDPFETSLKLLKDHKSILKIFLVNQLSIDMFPSIKEAFDAFDYVVTYKGPPFVGSNIGNVTFGLGPTSKYRAEETCEALHQLMSKLKTKMKDDVEMYFGTTNEEIVYDVALLRKEYGISGMPADIVDNFVFKSHHTKILRNKAIQAPKMLKGKLSLDANPAEEAERLWTFCEGFGFPVFVKPDGGAGSFGTSTVRSKNELLKWVGEMLNEKCADFVLQEYVDGPMYTFQVVVDKFQQLFFVIGSWQIGHWHSMLTELKPVSYITYDENDPEYIQLKREVSEMLFAFDAHRYYGTYFIEVMRQKGGNLKLIDIGCRPIVACGGLNWSAQEFKKIDTESVHILGPLVKYSLANLDNAKLSYGALANVYWLDRLGHLSGYREPQNLPSGAKIVRFVKWHQPGDSVRAPTTINDVSCEMSITAETQEELLLAINQLLSFEPAYYE